MPKNLFQRASTVLKPERNWSIPIRMTRWRSFLKVRCWSCALIPQVNSLSLMRLGTRSLPNLEMSSTLRKVHSLKWKTKQRLHYYFHHPRLWIGFLLRSTGKGRGLRFCRSMQEEIGSSWYRDHTYECIHSKHNKFPFSWSSHTIITYSAIAGVPNSCDCRTCAEIPLFANVGVSNFSIWSSWAFLSNYNFCHLQIGSSGVKAGGIKQPFREICNILRLMRLSPTPHFNKILVWAKPIRINTRSSDWFGFAFVTLALQVKKEKTTPPIGPSQSQ